LGGAAGEHSISIPAYRVVKNSEIVRPLPSSCGVEIRSVHEQRVSRQAKMPNAQEFLLNTATFWIFIYIRMNEFTIEN